MINQSSEFKRPQVDPREEAFLKQFNYAMNLYNEYIGHVNMEAERGITWSDPETCHQILEVFEYMANQFEAIEPVIGLERCREYATILRDKYLKLQEHSEYINASRKVF